MKNKRRLLRRQSDGAWGENARNVTTSESFASPRQTQQCEKWRAVEQAQVAARDRKDSVVIAVCLFHTRHCCAFPFVIAANA